MDITKRFWKNCIMLLIHSLSAVNALCAGLSLPESDAGIADSIGGELPVPYTAEELAVAPVGEIQKSYLRTVNQLRAALAKNLDSLPAGAEGKGSPWFGKFSAFKTGLEQVAASRLQSDCFAVVPHMVELLKVRTEDAPEFVSQNVGWVRDFGKVVVHAIERHIIDQNAVVAPEKLPVMITLFSTPGLQSGGDEREDTPMPMRGEGVMILGAEAVVTYLKSRPWQEAEKFQGGATGAQVFARYAASGDGLAVLKAKYATDPVTIAAKWDELAAWVAAQRSAEPIPKAPFEE